MISDSVRLWLVRHGETEWNVARRFLGWTDIGLTPAGRRQAADLRPLFADRSFDGVWSSDLSRASETARLALRTPVVDRRLREVDFGALEGQVWDELAPETKAALVALDGFSAPGGESIADVRLRLVAFCDELPPGDHAVFTHGGVIRLLRRECDGDGFPQHGELVVLDWTRRAHLPGP